MDTEAPKETGDHKGAVNVVNINKMDKKGTISLAKFDHILKVCFSHVGASSVSVARLMLHD